jgi:transposase-like protein
VCGEEYPVNQDNPIYQLERQRFLCGREDCCATYWHQLGIKGGGSPTAHLRSRKSDANARLLDGHKVVSQQARSAAKRERQAKIAKLFKRGRTRQEIARELNLKDYTVRIDLSEMGLVARKRNLDRTRALELADTMPWKQAAKKVGISHSQFCQWMKEAGRSPPPKKSSKAHLKTTAFAMYDQGKSWNEICSTIGIATSTFSQWLRARGRTQPNHPAA